MISFLPSFKVLVGLNPKEQENRRKLSFARSLSQDLCEREVQDIMDRWRRIRHSLTNGCNKPFLLGDDWV